MSYDNAPKHHARDRVTIVVPNAPGAVVKNLRIQSNRDGSFVEFGPDSALHGARVYGWRESRWSCFKWWFKSTRVGRRFFPEPRRPRYAVEEAR